MMQPSVELDLRTVPCPLSFVKAKLRLEKMQVGEVMRLYLDPGEPVEQVPNSLRLDGHRILTLEQQESGCFSLLVEKV